MSFGAIFDLDNTLCNTEATAEYRQRYDWRSIKYDVISRLPVSKDIIHMLKIMKWSGWEITVVSNNIETYCHTVIKHMGLHYGGKDPDINYFVCYHDVINVKPAPDGYALAYSLMDRPDCLLIVGDELKDWKAYLNLKEYAETMKCMEKTEMLYCQAKWFDVTKDNKTEENEFSASAPYDLLRILFDKCWLNPEYDDRDVDPGTYI